MTRSVSLWIVPFICVGIVAHYVRTEAAADIILRAADASITGGAWTVVADSSAAGGSALANVDRGIPKPATALASPASFAELTFAADAGTPYHLWLRGRAQDDSYDNDSVYVQFSDSVTSSGTPTWRIGTTSATSVVLEDCSGCGVSGWGWQDNLYGGLAAPFYFASSGTHTIRIQVREDGLSIDQIVLGSAAYLTGAPGPATHDTTILTGGGTPPPPPPGSVSLVRGPYLQQVGARSAVIVWASREPGPASAQVGTLTIPATSRFLAASVTGIEDQYQHEATVTGLSPATDYAYRLFVGGAAATAGTDHLRTAPETGTGRIRFVIFGDSGTGSVEQGAISSRIGADAVDFALHAGDIAYGNTEGTGDASYATYSSWFFNVYAPWLRRLPFFPSMGNHDSRPSNNWGQAYLDLFALPEDAGAGPYPDHAERYYSFDYGPVHFVALDTELAFQDPARRAVQLAWVEADLAAAGAQPWKVAFYHRSPFSAGGEHGSELAVRDAFAPIFERYGVQLSLSAHEHTYERSVPWRTSASSAGQAVTYVVSGGGGGPLYPAGQNSWTATSASEHHYVRLTIDGCLATLEAVRTTGDILDSHVLDRCAQSSDAAPPFVDFTGLSSGSSVSGITPVEAEASDDVQVEKVDLWIDGGLAAIDRQAPYAFAWNTATAAVGPHTLELRAYDINGNRATRTAIVTVVSEGTGSDGLPAGWQSQDIGAVGLPGSASYSAGRFTAAGAGADIWGTADAFRYVYRTLSGDGAIVARISSVSGSEAWTKVGVMVRASTDSSSPHASMFVSLGKGLAFQRRTAAGGSSTHTAGPVATAPYWVRLARTGNVVTASASADGTTWVTVGSDAVSLPATALIGLAVTSHTTTTLATGGFESVSVTTAETLPAGWHSDDVGAVGVGGSASESAGTFTVNGAGADVWGTADAFQMVWRTLEGNGEIVARVVAVAGAQPWTKAGVMMRATLDASSPHGFMLVSAAKGLAFQRRTEAGGVSTNTSAGGAVPYWVKLARQGQTLTASVSTDGVGWTRIGADTWSVTGPLYVGLAVTSHDASQLATGTFDNVSVVNTP